MSKLDCLFEPISIGNMALKNRIVMAPMTLDYANPDETPSDRQIAYYSERAKGGAGLIVTEVMTVDEDHRYQQASVGLYNDALIPHHKKLVDAVHEHGAKIIPQLSHTGPESLAPFYKGIEPMGPSVVRTQTTMQVCRELAIEEIPPLVTMFGAAARRAREAGYDGIELHAAHSYMLLGSFLSPLRNYRSDEYGGKLPGRMKLLLDVIAEIRKEAGEDFPIQVRLSGNERESGGRDINETVRMAPILVAAGVTAFHISGGVGDKNITQIIAGPEYANGYNANMAATLKQVVDVPVMSVGRNMTVDSASELLDNNLIDMAVFGRPLLADPELPNKARDGKAPQIRPCNSCQDCVDSTMRGGGSSCALNPRTGRESELPHMTDTENPKRVAVVGAGVAGLETARLAAQAGHQVTLLEKCDHLGGEFLLSATLLDDHKPYLNWLIAEIKRLGVDVKTNVSIDPQGIQQYKADVIVMASGGTAVTPSFNGDEQAHVLRGEALAKRILEGVDSIDGNVLVFGGSELAADIADTIARRRISQSLAPLANSVSLVNNSHRLADGAGKKRRDDIFRRFDRHGVRVYTGFNITSIDKASVTMADELGKSHELPINTVILTGSTTDNAGLLEDYQQSAKQVFSVGNCSGTGPIRNAILDAYQVVQKI